MKIDNYAKQAKMVINKQHKENVKFDNSFKTIEIKEEIMENNEKKETKVSQNEKSYTHHFTDLVQIIEYCKSIGYDDGYLIQGMENTLQFGYNMKKGFWSKFDTK